MMNWTIDQVDSGQLLVAAIGLLVAGLIKGTTGLGYSTCALPFLVSAVGLRSAIVIVPIPPWRPISGFCSAPAISERHSRDSGFSMQRRSGILSGTLLLAWVQSVGDHHCCVCAVQRDPLPTLQCRRS